MQTGEDQLEGVIARDWRAAVNRYATVHRLSPQELRLLLAAIAGESDKDAAAGLGCTRGTIGSYWQRIFAKTGQRPRAAVIAHVLRSTVTLDRVLAPALNI
ncbi:MAG: hypothetical protein QM756_42730 [Polyangiaceae bacterium]